MTKINQAEVLIGARSPPEIYRQLLIFPMLGDTEDYVWVCEYIILNYHIISETLYWASFKLSGCQKCEIQQFGYPRF